MHYRGCSWSRTLEVTWITGITCPIFFGKIVKLHELHELQGGALALDPTLKRLHELHQFHCLFLFWNLEVTWITGITCPFFFGKIVKLHELHELHDLLFWKNFNLLKLHISHELQGGALALGPTL